MKRFKLINSEPWDFLNRDRTNRMIVELLGIVQGSALPTESGLYILLKVVEPFEYENEPVEYMVATHRYAGDTEKKIAIYGGIVNIVGVRQGIPFVGNQQFSRTDANTFFIGNLHPLEGKDF
jgi:hypothetical protein